MNVLKNLVKVVSLSATLAFAGSAYAQVWGRINDGRGGGQWGGAQPQASWQQVDEVHFTDGETAIAIRNCQNARLADRRCNDQNYQCSPCSEIKHSDHSSYIVYQLVGGGGGWNPGPGRPGPGRPPGGGGGWNPGPGHGGAPVRDFIQTYHFYDKKTAVAKQKCDWQRNSMPECRSSNYECTPCTIESHTDHSQFDLYRISYQ